MIRARNFVGFLMLILGFVVGGEGFGQENIHLCDENEHDVCNPSKMKELYCCDESYKPQAVVGILDACTCIKDAASSHPIRKDSSMGTPGSTSGSSSSSSGSGRSSRSPGPQITP